MSEREALLKRQAELKRRSHRYFMLADFHLSTRRSDECEPIYAAYERELNAVRSRYEALANAAWARHDEAENALREIGRALDMLEGENDG